MKLIKLTCDQSSFKTINFNENGLSIIIGDGAKDENGTSNGVGKTLSLRLVHLCLGSNPYSDISKAVPDWIFTLHFSVDGNHYKVSRTGDGKSIWLLDKPIKIKEYRNWLNEQNFFELRGGIPYLSFRSLFKRFSRSSKADCEGPVRTESEDDYTALLRTIFLMGLDCNLAIKKHTSKLELMEANKWIGQYKKDPTLLEFFRAGTQPKVRLEHLEREIPKVKQDISEFKVAEDYRDIEEEANQLTIDLRETSFKAQALKQQIEYINLTIKEQPDISRGDLLALYEGIQVVFKPEALKHFEAVENFHHSLATNRRKRLEEERQNIFKELESLEKSRQLSEKKRDEKIKYLHGKRALDDYLALTQELSKLEDERARLNDYNEALAKLEKQKLEIKQKRLEDDRRATEYVESNPVAQFDQEFVKLAGMLYPRVAAGITLSANTNDNNQIRYDLTVSIEGDSSDGIGDASVLCFDWVILTLGLNHNMKMLWHDNRLFADIDPKVRATWLSEIANQAKVRSLQYIISLNTENFEAMKEHLDASNYQQIEQSEILTLKGDQTANKLLGIQFG